MLISITVHSASTLWVPCANVYARIILSLADVKSTAEIVHDMNCTIRWKSSFTWLTECPYWIFNASFFTWIMQYNIPSMCIVARSQGIHAFHTNRDARAMQTLFRQIDLPTYPHYVLANAQPMKSKWQCIHVHFHVYEFCLKGYFFGNLIKNIFTQVI